MATAFAPAAVVLLLAPIAALVLVGVGRRFGLSWHDLGMGRGTWRKGAGYGAVAVGLVAVLYLVAALLPATRGAFLDVRYDLALSSALVLGLVVIPIKTVLVEEIAFRGVLLGLLKRPFGTAWAVGLSSGLFGLWHVLPGLRLSGQNQAVAAAVGPSAGAQLLAVGSVVLFTTIAGVLFSLMRHRSGSLLAAAGLHWATNGLGVLVSALVWSAGAA